MIRFLSIGVLVGAIGFASAVSAGTTTYRCDVTPSREGAWIPHQMIIVHDDATGAVTIRDDLSQHYVGHAISGRVEVQNTKRVTFTWKLEGVGSAGDDDVQFVGSFNFRATIQAGSHRLSMTSKPLGYSNSFKGSGTCSQS